MRDPAESFARAVATGKGAGRTSSHVQEYRERYRDRVKSLSLVYIQKYIYIQVELPVYLYIMPVSIYI